MRSGYGQANEVSAALRLLRSVVAQQLGSQLVVPDCRGVVGRGQGVGDGGQCDAVLVSGFPVCIGRGSGGGDNEVFDSAGR
jgi:hypothetical protein